MPSKWGVQVQHGKTTYLYTSSEKAAEDVRNLDIVLAQWERTVAKLRLLRRKTEAARVEMLEREYNGKARKRRKRPTTEGQ